MSRLILIAVREYLAYVRTVGFWISMCLVPVALLMAFGAPALIARATPVPRLAVVDLTGKGYAADIAAAVSRPSPLQARRTPGGPVKPAAIVVPAPIPEAKDAAEAGRRLKPLLGPPPGGGRPALDAAAVIHDEGAGPTVDFWSRNVVDRSLEGVVGFAVAGRMRAERLEARGVPAAEVAALDNLRPKVVDYSPKAAGKVSLRDRLPGIVGFGLGMLLWMMIMTGAGALLNSVIEEKSSRILEVLLASASVPEVVGGKILGVAGVTATILALWLGLGGAAIAFGAPNLAGDLAAVLFGHGLILYFAVFLVGGYLMYASLFTAVGAFCETTREAQTLLAPIMMLLTIPLVFMGQAIVQPDAPAIAALAWFPLFTPFLMPVRAAADPPLWQVIGAAAMMAAAAGASLMLSMRAFRAGALSIGKVDAKAFFAHFFRGRAA
jgi:ABC-2 type transport system permease protein